MSKRDVRERVQSVVQMGLQMALDHYEEHLEPIQVEATDYYHGRPFGDEEEGRSKVVSTDLRDVTMAQMPTLLRIFLGSDSAVEYEARGPEDEEMAAQATDYVNYSINNDSKGFLEFQNWFSDALIRKIGIMKASWEESERLEGASYTGLDEQGLQSLMSDNSVEDVEVTAAYQMEVDGPTWYDARITRRKLYGCPKIQAIPNEEFVFTPNSRTLADAPLVAHIREVPQSYLIDDLGLDEELVREAAGKSRESESESLIDAREYHRGADRYENEEQDRDESQRPVLFAEAYSLIDVGEGAQLRMFWCLGGDHVIVNGDGLGELVDELPFAVLTPNPEAHTIVGLGNFDLTKDIQRIKSQVLRGTLNSLASAIEPQTEIVEGQVNMSDVLSPDINKVVRVRAPGMMREVKHVFVGSDTLPVLAYMDEMKENRTGTTKAAAGLDADSLQSATKAAVAATLSGSQQRIEMIARVFAETGVKDLFKILLRLITRHQNQSRIVRLRGRYVSVDPKHWDATMDVRVNVALGVGTPEERLGILMQTLTKQEEYLMNGAPFVSFVEIRRTLGKILESTGFSPDLFFKPWGPQEQQQWEQAQAQQPPKEDPAMIVAETDRMKVQMQGQIDQAKLQQEQQKTQMEDEREREKQERDAAQKAQEAKAKVQAQRIVDSEKARVEQEKLVLQRANQEAQIQAQREAESARNELERQKFEHQKVINADKLEIERKNNEAKLEIERKKIALQTRAQAAQEKAQQAAAKTQTSKGKSE